MVQYLVILLDNKSVAYCHVNNSDRKKQLIPLETLRAAIQYSMQENLMIQFVYPDSPLPKEYIEVIDSIDHANILPLSMIYKPLGDHATQQIYVTDTLPSLTEIENISIVIRMSIHEAIAKKYDIATLLTKAQRINLCYTDIETFRDSQHEDYNAALSVWSDMIVKLYNEGKRPQFNLLTNRVELQKMHNCEAGINNITIAPNGNFYICPAFYYDELNGIDNKLNHQQPSSNYSCGNITTGKDIVNAQLLDLQHAPICRICDAYHCHRCVWLNTKQTLDINTPGHEQCLVAHIERNASRKLIEQLRNNNFIINNDINEIDYLDPFVIANNWK